MLGQLIGFTLVILLVVLAAALFTEPTRRASADQIVEDTAKASYARHRASRTNFKGAPLKEPIQSPGSPASPGGGTTSPGSSNSR